MNLPDNLTKLTKKILPYILVWLLALVTMFVAFTVFREELSTYLAGTRWIPSPVKRILAWFRNYGILGPVIYTVFFGITSSLFFPAFLLSIAAAILFEPLTGFSVVMIGLLISAQTFYWLGRWGGESILDFFDDKWVNLAYQYLPQRSGNTVFLCRLVFFLPFHAFNAVCGVFRVPNHAYNIATFFGYVPRMLVYYYIGYSLKYDNGNLTLSAVFLMLLIVVQSIYGGILFQFYIDKTQKVE